MKRYYISKIVGDGSEENPYRPRVADYPVRWVGMIPPNPDGSPKYGFTFVLVAATDHQQLLDDPQIKGIPELSLDAQISTLSKAVRDKMLAYFNEEGIDRTGLTQQSTMREVLRRIGQHLQSTFNENKFDVADVTG
jgi:hypothetical protein